MQLTINFDENESADLLRLARVNNMGPEQVAKAAILGNVRKTPTPMRELFNEMVVLGGRLRVLIQMAKERGDVDLVADTAPLLDRAIELMDISWNFVESRRRKNLDEDGI